MNIQVIAEHSVDLDLLPPKANILDLGARGGQFSNYFKQLGHNVFSVDCDNVPGITHPNLAISNFNGNASIVWGRDPQATYIIPYVKGRSSTQIVECKTLQKFSEEVGISVFDVIKFDVESSERDIIMSLETAPAVQISCEFHLHVGAYGMLAVSRMEQKLHSLGYIPISHKMEKRHGLCENYWDSLWVLKDAKPYNELASVQWPKCETCGTELELIRPHVFACPNKNCPE